MFDFKNDKSWFVILVLLFAFMPIGILALIAKIIYTIYRAQNNDDTFTNSTNDYRRNSSEWSANDLASSLHEIEDDLKDSFETWKESSTLAQTTEDFDHKSVDSYDHKGYPRDLSDAESIIDVSVDETMPLPVEFSTTERQVTDEVVEEDEVTAEDHLSVDHLEVTLNEPIDLTFTDVHIDTEITFDDEPEDHDHQGEVPLKVIKCRMCETENRIYKIDIFETPTCEKCGMLLLDRN